MITLDHIADNAFGNQGAVCGGLIALNIDGGVFGGVNLTVVDNQIAVSLDLDVGLTGDIGMVKCLLAFSKAWDIACGINDALVVC